MTSPLENRLRKVAKPRFAWAKREHLSAFRLYDLDMPELPLAIDWYAGQVHVSEYPNRKQLRSGLEALRDDVRAAVRAVLEVPPERVFFKTHGGHAAGERAFERGGGASVTTVVEEHGLRFECNLTDYLDTGLFLDHRPMRKKVRALASGKRVLNLFAYTGAFSVHAIAGGARSITTVDLSKTYCDWFVRNCALNGFQTGAVVCDDVLAWVETQKAEYDLIVLDPPSFSMSKKMGRRFEIQRDHRWLVETVRRSLAPGGTLFFSTNLLTFELDAGITGATKLQTRADDFRRDVHQTWQLKG